MLTALAEAAGSRCARAGSWYARRGLRVHPLRPGVKLPLLERWQNRATTDCSVIEAWFREWPDAGVGIATGGESGVIVLDVDPRHGGENSLDTLRAEHGELPETWTVHTAGGGRHLYFRHPGGRVGNRTGLLDGVDLRGDGGYVVAPPTVLEGGHAYLWQAGDGPHEVALTAAPEWLLDYIGGQNEAHTATPPDEWARLVRDGAREGSRNQAVARLAGYLLRRRPAPRVVLELLWAWSESRCRPPLSDEEIARTVDSIARKEVERRRDG